MPTTAWAACSEYAGLATINEVNKERANGSDNAADFVEIKLLDTSIPESEFGTWNLTIQEDGGQGPFTFPLSGFEDKTPPWLVQVGMDVAIYIDFDAGMNLVLKDSLGAVIDYLDYDTSDGFSPLADASCTNLPFDTTIASSSGGAKRVGRQPDGIGDWDKITAQSTAPTEDSTNDPVPSNAPAASMQSITVVPGNAAVFTVTLSAVSGSDILINYQTQDGTAVAPGDYSSTTGSLTIPAGQLSGEITITTSVNASVNEAFRLLISSSGAIVQTTLAATTFTATSASCGPIDSTFGIYSDTNIAVGANSTINNNSITTGNTGGSAGIGTDGATVVGSLALPALDPANFPANSATNDANDNNSPIDGSSTVYYDRITARDNNDLYFSGTGPFHIDHLIVEDDADVYFSAGTYYINTLTMGDTTHLRVNSAPVVLHIGTTLDLGNDKIHINEHDGGAPEDLRIYLHANATVSGAGNNDKTKMKAIIVGAGNGLIAFGDDLEFTGVILSENNVTFGAAADLQLTTAQQASIGAVSTCLITEFREQCAAVFTNGLQISRSGGTIEFEDRAQLLNTSSLILDTPDINKNVGGSCGSGQCTASGTTSAALATPTFISNTTSNKIDVTGTQTVGPGTNEYEEIIAKENSVLTFSASQSTYIIELLEVEDNVTLNFAAGDYYIEEFAADKKDLTINVVGAGTVRIWSQKDIKFKDDALINSPGTGLAGESSKLIISTTKKIKVEKEATVSAFLIAGDDIEIKDDGSVFGAISSETEIKLKDDAIVTFQQSEIQNTNFGAACVSSGGTGLHHFLIEHDGAGINCVSEVVKLTAMDLNNNPVMTYAEEVVLTTQSNKGSWSTNTATGSFTDTTSNDGLARYTFADSDDGIAIFNLSYEEGDASLDLAAYQANDTTLRDDDSAPTLVFSPSGFTFTPSALSVPSSSSIAEPIPTQTAGAAFNLHLAAYGQTPADPVCGIIEAYTGAKSISFWFDYENPASGTLAPQINTVLISANEGSSTGQSVTFINGQASVPVKYKDVGQIQLHGKDAAISGSSNTFVVKPADIVIVDVESSSGVNNPGATNAVGSGFVAAGEAFVVTLEVRDAEGSITPNYGNETPQQTLKIVSSTLVLPAAGINGSADDGAIINDTSFAVTTTPGRFSGNSFRWDEYGIIKLTASVGSGSYLAAGNVTGTESGNIGRFYPDNFLLGMSSTAAACNNFTYMNQAALTVNYILQARGALANTLSNYDLGLLGASGVAGIIYHAENDNDGVDRAARLAATSTSWNNGLYSLLTSTNRFDRDTTPDGPFNALQLGLSVADSLDGRTLLNLNMNATTNTNCVALANCTATSIGAATTQRYGRMEVSNAFGPESEPLDVAVRTSYFDAVGFITNVDDDCTSYINAGAGLSNYQNGLPAVTVTSPVAATLLVDGTPANGAALMLSAPGAANSGSVDVTYDAPAWLEFNWQGAGDQNPLGTASFGQFRGHDRVIYWREVY